MFKRRKSVPVASEPASEPGRVPAIARAPPAWSARHAPGATSDIASPSARLGKSFAWGAQPPAMDGDVSPPHGDDDGDDDADPGDAEQAATGEPSTEPVEQLRRHQRSTARTGARARHTHGGVRAEFRDETRGYDARYAPDGDAACRPAESDATLAPDSGTRRRRTIPGRRGPRKHHRAQGGGEETKGAKTAARGGDGGVGRGDPRRRRAAGRRHRPRRAGTPGFARSGRSPRLDLAGERARGAGASSAARTKVAARYASNPTGPARRVAGVIGRTIQWETPRLSASLTMNRPARRSKHT